MVADSIRIIAPEHLSNAQVAEALIGAAQKFGGEPLAKALAHPNAPADRKEARRQYERLEQQFAAEVGDVFEAAEIVAEERDRLDPGRKHRPPEQHDRAHQRLVALLNAKFGRSYKAAFELGLVAGGATRAMLPNEEAIVKRDRLNENAFAANFVTDILNDEVRMPVEKRAAMYGRALEEVYNQGIVYADLSADRYLKWVMNHTEHLDPSGNPKSTENCIDCSVIAGDKGGLAANGIDAATAKELGAGGRWGNGVYSARELAKLAVTPQSGKLACTTHCHCRLDAVKRPSREPVGKEIGQEFRSLAPKDFTGDSRRKLRPRRDRYRKRAARTEHGHIGRQ